MVPIAATPVAEIVIDDDVEVPSVLVNADVNVAGDPIAQDELQVAALPSARMEELARELGLYELAAAQGMPMTASLGGGASNLTASRRVVFPQDASASSVQQLMILDGPSSAEPHGEEKRGLAADGASVSVAFRGASSRPCLAQQPSGSSDMEIVRTSDMGTLARVLRRFPILPWMSSRRWSATW